jgi:hypothetical protein
VSSDRHKEILFEALQRAGAERAAYLDEACGDDASLRERVDGLLRAHDRAGGLMDESPGSGDTTLHHHGRRGPAVEGTGANIGDYRLGERIGEGGFGFVYLAEQLRPIRVIGRFAAERQALAMMDHPGIARIYDAGTTPSGRPYFAMEHVDGLPVTQYADRRALTLRQRLELFVRICLAVQHAHQKGIIHRDLKPTNVLVTEHDGDGQPKVIDFGIAKATETPISDQSFHTESHQMLGTPQYMSPEQAEMRSNDIDTRSDVYSLGVLLYELLAGVTPFASARLREAGYPEIQRIISEEQPPRPSTRIAEVDDHHVEVIARLRGLEPIALRRQLRGDVDWIILKAMDKDPRRRYPSASELAEDVRRHLENEPVVARRPGAGYLAGKFILRHRVVAAAAAIAVAALVSGLVLATVGLQQASTQRGRCSPRRGRRAARSGRGDVSRRSRRCATRPSSGTTASCATKRSRR